MTTVIDHQHDYYVAVSPYQAISSGICTYIFPGFIRSELTERKAI